MSILIEGMELPKGKEVFLRIDEKGEVYVYGSYPTKLHKAVPVPPHGRLIDADALHYNRIRIAHPDGAVGGWNAVVMSAEIKDAPTIIPADPEKEEDHVNPG